MEEYRRSRQGAAARRVKVGTVLKPGQVVVDYPVMRILVTDGTSAVGQAVIKKFRKFNCRVTFTAANEKEGNKLAQLTGAQYNPGSALAALERLTTAGDAPAAIINLDDSEVENSLPLPPDAKEAGPEAVASWCLFAAHPTNGWLGNKK